MELERIRILLQQDRYLEAEIASRAALGGDTDRATALIYLSAALAGQKKLDEAQRAAEQAIAEDPERPVAFAQLAEVLRARDDLSGAQRAIETALRFDAEDPDYLCELALILLLRGNTAEAMQAVQRGLQSDPDSVSLRHIRTQVLMAERDLDSAGESARESVSEDPEDTVGHTQLGFVALRRNDIKTAETHFTQALKLDPENETAKHGLLTVLKSRRMVFRLFLAYTNWMQSMAPGTRWMVLIGGLFVIRAIRSAAKERPEMQPFAMVVVAVYMAFVYLSWTIDPLTNLLLRLDPVGRVLLSDDDRRASNFVGSLLAVALTLGVLGFALPSAWIAAVVAALLVLPVAGTFAAEGRKRRRLTIATVVIAALGVVGALLALTGASSMSALPLAGFFLAIVVFTWLGGALSART